MIIVENFPNMGKHIVHQVLRSPESPIEAKPRRNIPRHILIKLAKIKHNIKSNKGKAVNNIQRKLHMINS